MDTEYPKGPAIFRTLLFQLEAGIPGGILGVSRGGLGVAELTGFSWGCRKWGVWVSSVGLFLLLPLGNEPL